MCIRKQGIWGKFSRAELQPGCRWGDLSAREVPVCQAVLALGRGGKGFLQRGLCDARGSKAAMGNTTKSRGTELLNG